MKDDYEALEKIEPETETFEEEFDLREEDRDEFGEFGALSGESPYQGEWEDEFETYGEMELGELEGDEFFGKLWRGVKRVARTVAPVLKTLAPIAGRVVGGVVGGPLGIKIGGTLGDVVSNLEEGEFEDYYDKGDTEDEINATAVPGLTAANEFLAEELAAQAANSESEAEAQSLIGGVTSQFMSGAPMKVKRATPLLVKRASCLTKLLRKSPKTKPLIKVIPTIQKRTVATLVRKAAKGKPITPQTAVRTMANQTVRLLSSPKRTAIALTNNNLKCKKLKQHQAVSRVEKFI